MSYPICRHIRINGDRCGSPALRNQPLCYYHDRAHRHHHDTITAKGAPTRLEHTNGRFLEPTEIEYYAPVEGPLKLDLPPLEDLDSIQFALSLLLTAIAQNRIAPSRAGRLIYGLQLASKNARRLLRSPAPIQFVTETTVDELGHQLAAEHGNELAANIETEYGKGAGEDPQPLSNTTIGVQPTEDDHHPDVRHHHHGTQAAHAHHPHHAQPAQYDPGRPELHCPGSD